ncbi:hypothetical protein [uncultured Halovibrio sp.]|uniref:hypothetical protein n=1 Tax=uncultured Halovibrio sp. TaxID=985049 RepID=UPI0025E47065|nr:hypothetical protein [uncultured Halovibrio sp.]
MSKQQLTITVIGARRFDIDGNKIGQIFTMEPADPDDADRIGNDVMKWGCDHALVEKIEQYESELPCEFDAEAMMKAGGGQKAQFKLLNLAKRQISGSKSSGASGDKSAAAASQ